MYRLIVSRFHVSPSSSFSVSEISSPVEKKYPKTKTNIDTGILTFCAETPLITAYSVVTENTPMAEIAAISSSKYFNSYLSRKYITTEVTAREVAVIYTNALLTCKTTLGYFASFYCLTREITPGTTKYINTSYPIISQLSCEIRGNLSYNYKKGPYRNSKDLSVLQPVLLSKIEKT